MAWQQRSGRRAPLPPDWQRIRRVVLDRDGYACTIGGPRCTGIATDVDHIGAPDDHRIESLRSACAPCHMARTAAQSHAARPSRRRTAEAHPGLVAQRQTARSTP